MTVTSKVKVLNTEHSAKEKTKPTLIKFHQVPMVANHSFRATVQEIINFSKVIDVCRVGLVGDMHSGKSTLSKAIAHYIHKKAELPYKIKILYKEDLLNFKATLQTLESVNYILIFDDVSFLGAEANKKQIEMVKSAVTTIRHLEGGKDVKIIVMMNYHYSFGLDKYLRTADFKYITTVSSSENENMEKMFGTKYKKKITDFKKYRQQAVVKGNWVMKVGKNQSIKYNYREPFQPGLFWNEQSLRFIVTPTREFEDKICSKCAEAEGTLITSDVPVSQFIEESEKKFGASAFKAAVKLDLFTEGMTVYGKNVVQAYRYLNKARSAKQISLEQCAVHYDLEITNTRLRKKLDGVVSD